MCECVCVCVLERALHVKSEESDRGIQIGQWKKAELTGRLHNKASPWSSLSFALSLSVRLTLCLYLGCANTLNGVTYFSQYSLQTVSMFAFVISKRAPLSSRLLSSSEERTRFPGEKKDQDIWGRAATKMNGKIGSLVFVILFLVVKKGKDKQRREMQKDRGIFSKMKKQTVHKLCKI